MFERARFRGGVAACVLGFLLACKGGVTGSPDPAVTPEPEIGAAAGADPSVSQIVAANAAAVVQVRVPGGAGTGFIVRADGVVATNLHVILGAPSADVVTEGGASHPVVAVLAVDEVHDLVLLQLAAAAGRELPVVALGDSDAVAAGDPVIAIGNPLGVLDHTVSDGLISSIRAYDDTKLLQISAPISVGSSGGPVFDRRGQVVGVATMILDAGQNLNFAVPINYLRPMLDRAGTETVAAVTARLAPTSADAPVIERKIPVYSSTTVAGCSRAEQDRVVIEIGNAIDVGAPIYNVGEHDACYRIYEGATRRLRDTLKGCGALKKELEAGLRRAAALPTPTERAWAMRDLFDGMLALLTQSG